MQSQNVPRKRRLIRLPALREKYDGRSRASIYRDIADGTLPPPIKIGGSSFWDEAEVDAAIEVAAEARGEAA